MGKYYDDAMGAKLGFRIGDDLDEPLRAASSYNKPLNPPFR